MLMGLSPRHTDAVLVGGSLFVCTTYKNSLVFLAHFSGAEIHARLYYLEIYVVVIMGMIVEFPGL